jgi:hypothetical protein
MKWNNRPLAFELRFVESNPQPGTWTYTATNFWGAIDDDDRVEAFRYAMHPKGHTTGRAVEYRNGRRVIDVEAVVVAPASMAIARRGR